MRVICNNAMVKSWAEKRADCVVGERSKIMEEQVALQKFFWFSQFNFPAALYVWLFIEGCTLSMQARFAEIFS